MTILSPVANKKHTLFSRALRAYIFFGIGGLLSCLVLNIVSALKEDMPLNEIMNAIIHKNVQIPESWHYPFAAWVAVVAIISIITAFRPAKKAR